jgi:amidohydrolase
MDQAATYLPTMVRHRRVIHAHPEIGLELPETHAYLELTLRSLGINPEVHEAGGLTARIRGTEDSGLVRVLRADMDALPLTERTNLPYASTTDGAMHACGHDLHMAMLLGAAEMFTAHPPRHDVVLAFQPGEESDRGALELLKHKNLKLKKGTSAFAIHVNSIIESGVIAFRRGKFMAYGDWFKQTFSGPGGHASAPDLAGNPVRAIADFVRHLESVVDELGISENLVATVTEILSGNTVNVIPTEGRARGTLRTLSVESRARLHQRIKEIATQAAIHHGLQSTTEIMEGYPAVIGDDAFIDAFLDSIKSAGFSSSLAEMKSPSMVIEDFSYLLQKWPGAMVYLGAKAESKPSFNHSDDVLFDEAAMTTGLALHRLVADLDFRP